MFWAEIGTYPKPSDMIRMKKRTTFTALALRGVKRE
jgi:hypothetical protein